MINQGSYQNHPHLHLKLWLKKKDFLFMMNQNFPEIQKTSENITKAYLKAKKQKRVKFKDSGFRKKKKNHNKN